MERINFNYTEVKTKIILYYNMNLGIEKYAKNNLECFNPKGPNPAGHLT